VRHLERYRRTPGADHDVLAHVVDKRNVARGDAVAIIRVEIERDMVLSP